jgi:pimeloyl-ACP methyl ester carboxylesterase
LGLFPSQDTETGRAKETIMKDRIAETRFRAPLFWIPLGIIGALLLAIASLSLIQVVATSIEKKANPAPGALVRVGGRRIHVLAEGSGATTFVLLGGGGVGAPALEYRPLWSRLAERGRVAVVEYPGYGWSEDTRAPRKADAIVEEIRAALLGSGFKPPYVLVAHSLGGIYAMAYARSHADELGAVIALDTTLPRALIQERERSGTEAGSRIKGIPRFDGIARGQHGRALRLRLPSLSSGADDPGESPGRAQRGGPLVPEREDSPDRGLGSRRGNRAARWAQRHLLALVG